MTTFALVHGGSCTADRTLPPEQQDAAVAAIGSPEVMDLDSGHMAMIGRPAELAAILNEVAARPR
jgi:hypothetical protein